MNRSDDLMTVVNDHGRIGHSLVVNLICVSLLICVKSIMKERVILCVLVLGNRCMCRGSLVVCN